MTINQCPSCFNEIKKGRKHCSRQCYDNRFSYSGVVLAKTGAVRFESKEELKEIMALQVQDYTIKFDK